MSDLSPPRSLAYEVFDQSKYYALAIAGAAAALGGVYAVFDEQLDRFDYTEPRVQLFAAVTLLAIAVGVVLPAWRDRIRRASLIKIGEGATRELTDYFRLAPRDQSDHDTFQRGDRAHATILQWIIDAGDFPFLFLTGRSGVGKSSLLAAYVIPELRQLDSPFVVIQVRGYGDPLGALLAALMKPGAIWERPSSIDDPRSAMERAAKHVAPSRLLIIIDQFEEFLILNDPAAQAPLCEFLEGLEEEPIKGGQILFSARSDREYLAELQSICPARMALKENWFVVDGFEHAEARLFVEGSNLQLPERIVSDVMREAQALEDRSTLIRPVVLNLLGVVLNYHAGRELHSRRTGGLVHRFLEATLRRPELADIAPKILNHLITDAGTKRQMSEEALEAEVSLTSGEARGCLSLLSQDGLVREIDRATHTWEVSHDFVASALSRTLGRLRPRRVNAVLRVAGPIALSLWLLAGIGSVPFYYGVLLPEEIRRNGIDLRRVEGEWAVAFHSDHTPTNAATTEVDRVLPLLHRLGGIRELEVSNQSDMVELPLEGFNALTTLEISRNDSLKTLEIPALDALTSLDVRHNTNLDALEIAELDALTSLVVEYNTNLQALSIPELDELESLDVSNNANLQELDLPQLDTLTSLIVSLNPELDALEIPPLDALTSLDVSYNADLKALEIPQLEALTSLRVKLNNKLETLQIPRLDSLTSLNISHNISLRALEIPQLYALLDQYEVAPDPEVINCTPAGRLVICLDPTDPACAEPVFRCNPN